MKGSLWHYIMIAGKFSVKLDPSYETGGLGVTVQSHQIIILNAYVVCMIFILCASNHL